MTTSPAQIIVNGIVYTPKPDHTDRPVRIVILQRGWVMIGHWARNGDMCTLDNASVIRRWGTTKGLGDLRTGPKANTVLDPAGHVEFHILTTVAAIDCEAGKWAL